MTPAIIIATLLAFLSAYMISMRTALHSDHNRKKVAKGILIFYIQTLYAYIDCEEPEKLNTFNIDLLTQYSDVYYNNKELQKIFETFIFYYLKWINNEYVPPEETSLSEYEESIKEAKLELKKLLIKIE